MPREIPVWRPSIGISSVQRAGVACILHDSPFNVNFAEDLNRVLSRSRRRRYMVQNLVELVRFDTAGLAWFQSETGPEPCPDRSHFHATKILLLDDLEGGATGDSRFPECWWRSAQAVAIPITAGVCRSRDG